MLLKKKDMVPLPLPSNHLDTKHLIIIYSVPRLDYTQKVATDFLLDRQLYVLICIELSKLIQLGRQMASNV